VKLPHRRSRESSKARYRRPTAGQGVVAICRGFRFRLNTPPANKYDPSANFLKLYRYPVLPFDRAAPEATHIKPEGERYHVFTSKSFPQCLMVSLTARSLTQHNMLHPFPSCLYPLFPCLSCRPIANIRPSIPLKILFQVFPPKV